MIGIITEALVAELILLTAGTSRLGYLLVGITIGLVPLIHNIVTKTILFGAAFVPMLIDTARGISEQFGYGLGWVALGLYVVMHVIAGTVAALLAWSLFKRISTILDRGI